MTRVPIRVLARRVHVRVRALGVQSGTLNDESPESDNGLPNGRNSESRRPRRDGTVTGTENRVRRTEATTASGQQARLALLREQEAEATEAAMRWADAHDA